MPSNWTPLHRELGIDVRPLQYSDFERAVEAGVEETADLDWKQQPPAPEKKEDFASDVAAMANGRGGVICIGVRDEKGTSAAVELMPVDVTDQARRNLAQTVTALVRPRIANFEVDAVPETVGGTTGILIVVVRPSSNAPHVIEKRGEAWLRIPYRQGAGTFYMNEQELSRAYTARSLASETNARRHEELVEDAINRVDTDGLPWLIAAAVPIDPVPRELQEPLTLSQRRQIVLGARDASARLLPYTPWRTPIVGRMQPEHYNQRRGPRAWMSKGSTIFQETGMTRISYMMLYDDGSTVLAVQSGQIDLETDAPGVLADAGMYSIFDLESLAADFFSVVDMHALALGTVGSVTVATGSLRNNSGPRLEYLIDRELYFENGRYRRVADSIGVQRVRQVRLDYEPNIGESNRRRAATGLAGDIEGQFGVSVFGLFRDTDPAVASPLDGTDIGA